MTTIYTKVDSLPEMIQANLKSLGFHRSDIGLNAQETYCPFQGGGSGYRCFSRILNLSTGEKKDHVGSWGGSNMFNPGNQVDNDTSSYPIPPNTVVIEGRQGGDRPVSCSLILRPDMMAPYLPAPSSITERQKYILKCYRSLTSAGRKNEWERNSLDAKYSSRPEEKEKAAKCLAPSDEELKDLERLGFLKKAGKGYTITAEGRNQVPGL